MRAFWAASILLSAGCVGLAPDLAETLMIRHADSVTVRLFTPDNLAQASGVVLGEHDTPAGCAILVGTAGHVVIHDGKPMRVTLDRPEGSVAARVSGSTVGDAAAAEFIVPGACDTNAYATAALTTETVARGQKVFGSGYPRGYSFFAWGTIMEPLVTDEGIEFLTAAYPAAPGNSGGPLFNQAGQVVGVLSGGFPKAPMLAFFARAGQLRVAANKLSGWRI